MKPSRIAAVIALLAALAAGGLLRRQTLAVQQTTAGLAAANHETDELNGKLRQLQQATHALEAAQAAAQPVPVAVRNPAAASERLARARLRDLINQDPDVHEAVGRLVEGNNVRFFGPLLRSAGLSDAQVARAEYLLGQMEDFGGLGPVPLSFKTDPRSAEEIQAELVQVIGPAGTASLATYLINRSVTIDLAGHLSATGIPLSSQQQEQLTQILVATNRQPAPPGDWDNPALTKWAEATVQAKDVLSPSQLIVFKAFAVSRFGANLK